MVPIAQPSASNEADSLPEAFANLRPLGSHIHPIIADEYRERLQRVQKLMTESEPKYDALFVAQGTSLYHFTGIRWGMSEQLLALVLATKKARYLWRVLGTPSASAQYVGDTTHQFAEVLKLGRWRFLQRKVKIHIKRVTRDAWPEN